MTVLAARADPAARTRHAKEQARPQVDLFFCRALAAAPIPVVIAEFAARYAEAPHRLASREAAS